MGLFSTFLNNLLTNIEEMTLSEYDKNIRDIDKKTNGLSYDELNDIREDYRLDTSNVHWEKNLNYIDRKIETASIPIKNKIRSMSDEELTSEENKVWEKCQEDEKIFSNDKRPYAEKRKDDSFKKHEKDFRYYDNLRCEEERRNVEKKPDKFPYHREHGYNLYKKDGD